MRLSIASKTNRVSKDWYLRWYCNHGWRSPEDIDAENYEEYESVREDNELCTGLVVFSE